MQGINGSAIERPPDHQFVEALGAALRREQGGC